MARPIFMIDDLECAVLIAFLAQHSNNVCQTFNVSANYRVHVVDVLRTSLTNNCMQKIRLSKENRLMQRASPPTQ